MNKKIIFDFLRVSNITSIDPSVANQSIKLKDTSIAGEDREKFIRNSILDYFSSDIELERRLTSQNQFYHGII